MFPNVFPKAALPCTIYPERGIYFDSLGSFQNFPWVVLGATLDLKSWINFSCFDLKHKLFETLWKVNIPNEKLLWKERISFCSCVIFVSVWKYVAGKIDKKVPRAERGQKFNIPIWPHKHLILFPFWDKKVPRAERGQKI